MAKSFENKKLEEWSKDDAREWLKFCLIEYNLDDPRIAQNFNLNGKTLKIFHDFREFNKFYSQSNAEKLHRDLDMRQRKKVEGISSADVVAPEIKFEPKKIEHNLFDPFLPHLEKIDTAFAAIIKKDKAQGSNHSTEMTVEALFTLTGNIEKVPEVCLMNRLTTPLFEPKFINTSEIMQSPETKLENGHISLRLPTDIALGSLVKNFYLQKYPIIAESTIEHMLYLGQQHAIPTNHKARIAPPVIYYPNSIPYSPKIPRCEAIHDDLSEFCEKKVSSISNDSGFFSTPKQSNENNNNLEDDENCYDNAHNNNLEKVYFNLSAKGKHIIADYSTEINNEAALVFDYDENLTVGFRATSYEKNEPKIVTASHCVHIEIENTTVSQLGFALRAYNLSKPGSQKIVYPSGKGLKVLSPKEKWDGPFELQQSVLNSNRDYIIFELLVCELSNSEPRWNIQRSYILICEEGTKNTKSSEKLQTLVHKHMGNEKRKHCILILLESLHHLIRTDEEKGYWLTTQLLLIPEFQRPHFLILCWLVIGTYVYQGVLEDFEKRKFATLMNAKDEIKKRITNMETKTNQNLKCKGLNSNFLEKRTLKSVLDWTDKSEIILVNYLKKNASVPNSDVALPPRPQKNSDSILPIIKSIELESEIEDDYIVMKIPSSKSESAISEIVLTETSHLNKRPHKLLLHTQSRDISILGCEIIEEEFSIKCSPFDFTTKLDFGYEINKTEKSQSTCLPNVNHLSTFKIDNHLEGKYQNAKYEIKLNIKTKFTKNSTDYFRFILENNDTVTDVTEETLFKVEYEHSLCTATINIMGIYRVMLVKTDPSIPAIETVKETSLSRPLYFELYAKKLEQSKELTELICCVTSSCIDNIHSTYSHMIPLVREEVDARYNDDICIQLESQNTNSIDRLFSDFTHNFLFKNYTREFSRVVDTIKIEEKKFTAKLSVNNKMCLTKKFSVCSISDI